MSKLLEQINKEVEQKEPTDLGDLMLQITSRVNKIQKGNYLENGLVPVYDQGNNDISGYSNDVENAYSGKFPVVIFGDHTLKLRKIMSSFYMGADGNQLIEPIDDNLLDRNYFYYLLLARKPKSYGYERHFKYLKEISIKLPSFLIQKKIAEILSAYDAKIENNNKIIKNLEATAQTIFNEWFVKFEFPSIGGVPVGRGGDLNSEIQPPRLSATPPQEGNKYKSSGGKMVESEMGEIPEGWEVFNIRDLFDIKYGKNLPTSKISKSGLYPVYGAGGIIGFYNEKNSDGKNILITCRGNGSGTIWRTRESGFITNNSFTIKPKIDFNYINFVTIYFVLNKSNIASSVSGSAQPQITIEGINSVKVLLPEKDILNSFQNKTTQFFNLMDILYKQNENLKESRDQLLAKLI